MSNSSNETVNKSGYNEGVSCAKAGKAMRKRSVIYAIMIASLVWVTAGCGQQPAPAPSSLTPGPSATPTDDYLDINPEQQPVKQPIILYYKNRDSEFLSPVTRNVYVGDTPIELQVMAELLKGPQGNETQTVAQLIPTGTEMLYVTIKGNTVFVNFNSVISSPLNLQSLWGESYSTQDPALLEQQSRELLVYSIVNTMTELPGISSVKILVDNVAATYSDLGLSAWTEGNVALSGDTALPSYPRNPAYIMQPADVVQLIMNEWQADQPNWNRVYRFLASTKADGSQLPGLTEMQSQWPAINRRITMVPNTVPQTQEVRGDKTALVSVSYEIERVSGINDTYALEYFHLIWQGGVWKLMLPPQMLDENYGK